jgi:hypothetical protein
MAGELVCFWQLVVGIPERRPEGLSRGHHSVSLTDRVVGIEEEQGKEEARGDAHGHLSVANAWRRAKRDRLGFRAGKSEY